MSFIGFYGWSGIINGEFDSMAYYHRYMSNFHPSPFTVEGKKYATAEHYYQANKSVDEKSFEYVRLAPTPNESKQRGRSIEKRADWDSIKFEIMLDALTFKFAQNAGLRERLLSTTEDLHEMSPKDYVWGWGVGDRQGEGEDLLGKALMQVREELREERKFVQEEPHSVFSLGNIVLARDYEHEMIGDICSVEFSQIRRLTNFRVNVKVPEGSFEVREFDEACLTHASLEDAARFVGIQALVVKRERHALEKMETLAYRFFQKP